jgi:HB1/ASXL restriction endonuclease-like protein with HTH domain
MTATKKPKTAKAKKPAKHGTDGKMSALDAAAKVLAASKQPLNAKELIAAMEAKGYWTSPGGKTPHATIAAANRPHAYG